MKSLRGVLVFAVSFILGSALFHSSITAAAEGENTVEFRPEGEIKSVKIDWSAGKVELKPYNGNTVYIVQKGKNGVPEKYHAKPEISEDTLIISDIYKNKGFNFFSEEYTLEVSVPQKWMDKFETVKITTVSGDIEVKDLKSKNLTLSSVSGEVEVKNVVSSGKAAVDTVSGAISTEKLTSPSVEIRSTSGNIESEVNSEKISVSSTSGNVTAENLQKFKNISAETVSGGIKLILAEGLESVNFSTVSGSSDFKVSKDSPVTVTTVSGSLSVELKKPSVER